LFVIDPLKREKGGRERERKGEREGRERENVKRMNGMFDSQ